MIDILLEKYNFLVNEVKEKQQARANHFDSYNLLMIKEWMLVVPRSKVCDVYKLINL